MDILLFGKNQSAPFSSPISMDGRGGALDNVFVERLWRTVKYEEISLKDDADGWEAESSLGRYFRFNAR